MSKHTTGYCTQYGIPAGSPLGDLVDHLREEHRIKLGTDYWVTKNAHGQYHDIISKHIWRDDVLIHMQEILGPKHFFMRVKEKPGKQDRVVCLDMKSAVHLRWLAAHPIGETK